MIPEAPSTTVRAMAHMLDDASQFPPGNVALRPAWAAHLRWREHEHAKLVGRFLLPVARAGELTDLLSSGQDAELGVVAAGEPPEEVGALLDGPARVTSIELRGGIGDLARWRAQVPHSWIFLEGAPVQDVARVRADDHQVGAKLRCGGLRADTFPSCEQVAAFIADCVRLDVPFKATAGLHAPLRHWDPEIGSYHHGFLNLWSATAAAARGASAAELESSLAAEELGRLPALGREELERARRWFTAFGTCSIAEPLQGLRALRLLGDD